MIKSRPDKSLTLLELIISVALISIIVLGFTSLDLYSRHNVLLASRRSRVQNALSYVLDHMTKEIGKAIGDNTNIPDSLPINTDDIAGNTAFKVKIDKNNNGKWDGPANDIQIAYAYDTSSHEIWYYSDFTNYPNSHQTIAKNIMPDFSDGCPTKESCVKYDEAGENNYIEVRLAGRWNAAIAVSQDNPTITMLTRVKMFGVSTD